MKRPLPRWLHGPAYYGIRAALSAATVGDRELTVHGAAAAGRWFAGLKLNRKRLRRGIDNLGVAFPEWDEERRREYAVRAYEHLFMLVAETVLTPRLLSEDGWSDHLSLGDLGTSVRHLLAGQRGGRPCVLITGHCGNWELLGYTMALLGFPVHALYRPLDLEPLDRWVRQTRERRGLVLVDKFGATEDLPRLMERGGAAGFVADQNAGDRGLFVPFFGRLASTYKTIGLLAVRYNAPILCGMARRVGWGGGGGGANPPSSPLPLGGGAIRYTIDVTDVIEPEDWAGQPDPLFYVAARYRRAIELAVRRAPEQYLWMHRYWKSRPRHERLGRRFPGALREQIRQLPWITGEELARIEEWSERDAREAATGGGAGGRASAEPEVGAAV